MTQMAWPDVIPLLHHPRCQGAGAVQVMATEPFYDEDGLPFGLAEGDIVVHVRPRDGFRKDNLAGSPDELLLIADCPDDEGWLVPEDLVARWMNRHVACPDLEDILVSHPLYEFLTMPDEDGLARGGPRGHLIQWIPGVPTIAVLHPPEFLPGDPEAPAVNRDRDAYAAAVVDLLRQLEGAFPLVEIEVGLRFGDDPVPWDDEDIGESVPRVATDLN